METAIASGASEDLHDLGEDLITTSARIIRWLPPGPGVDLSLSATRLLARLSDGGPTRISDLAVAERSSQPTITNHVKRLEAAHLVDRRPDPRDARASMIALSDEGRRKLAEIRVSLGDTLQPYLARLSPAERAALRDGLDVMRALMALPRR